MSEPMEPIDPALDALLEAERERPEDAGRSARAERVLAAVMVTVGGGTAGGAPPSSGGGGAGRGAATGWSASTGIVGVVSLAIGIALGAGMHAAWTERGGREEPVETGTGAGAGAGTGTGPATGAGIEPGTESGAGSGAENGTGPEAGNRAGAGTDPGAGADAAPSGTETGNPTRAASGAGATTALAAGRTADAGVGVLARESALIARAQSALARGATDLAIAALREHEIRHPRGQLAEEREALWVAALVSAGDLDGARVRAARFRASHPGSPLLPAIEAALGASP